MRHPPRAELVDHDTHRKDVRPRIDHSVGDLLGSHEARRADQLPLGIVPDPSPSTFAMPKSMSFTAASRPPEPVTSMFDRFEIAVDNARIARVLQAAAGADQQAAWLPA